MGTRNISRAILLALSIVSAVQTVVGQRDTLSVHHYTHGVRLATEGRYAEAREEFGRALEANPDHDPSLYEMANALAADGDMGKALEHSARAAALDPDNSWYKGQQGRFLVAMERYDEALEIFEKMTAAGGAFDPDNYRVLALLYYRKGRMDDALATLDSVDVRMGLTAEVTEMKRSILIEDGRIEQAAAVTEEFVAASPYDEPNRLALVELYAYQRRDSLAAAVLKEVVEINPDNVEALEMLAERYASRGETALYLATLKQFFALPNVSLKRKIERAEALVRNVNFYRTHFYEVGELALSIVTTHSGEAAAIEFYADHAVRAGDPEGALSMLKGLSERADSASREVFSKIIEIEAYLQRPDSVARWSARALEVHPGAVEIYLLRSGVLQYLKRPKEARRTLTSALRAAATDSLKSEVWGAIGTLWHEKGNNRKTFAAYEKALKLSADNALVLNNYSYFLALEGQQLDRALGMAKRAVRLKQNDATYLDTYAWVLYKTGDYAEARRVMQQALPLDRDQNSELLMHYGDILWALGENFMASVYWKKARDAGWEPVSEIEERLERAK